MKLRSPWLLKAAGFGIAGLARLWRPTLRSRWWFAHPRVLPTHPDRPRPYIYAFWHEYMPFPASHYGRQDVYVLISDHADGKLVAEACRHLGFHVVHGSTTRGGVRAVREILRLGPILLGVTPDGPRGPRRQVQAG